MNMMFLLSNEMSVESNEPIIFYISGFQLVVVQHLNGTQKDRVEAPCGRSGLVEGERVLFVPSSHQAFLSFISLCHFLLCPIQTNRLDLGQAKAMFLLHSLEGECGLTECLEEAINIRSSKYIIFRSPLSILV